MNWAIISSAGARFGSCGQQGTSGILLKIKSRASLASAYGKLPIAVAKPRGLNG
jgi:hypothetical protein